MASSDVSTSAMLSPDTLSPAMLSSEQIAAYQTDGYLLIDNVIPKPLLEELQLVTQQYIADSAHVSQDNDLYDLDDGHCADNPRPNRIKTPYTQHVVFQTLLQSPLVITLLKQLLGPNVRLHNSKLNTKAGGGGTAVQWHQDWGFYPHTNDDLLALGFMLSDIGPDDGPLQVVPGSHCGPVLSHHNEGVFCGAIDPEDPEAKLSDAVSLTGAAGAMSIHHVRTLHGSAPNISSSPRLLLLYECGAADAWPINGNQSIFAGMNQAELWARMQQNMVCGEQATTPRLASVPVRMPLPPPADTSSLFAVQKSGAAKSAFA